MCIYEWEIDRFFVGLVLTVCVMDEWMAAWNFIRVRK